MDTAHSTATPTYEYQPTIIDDRFLIERLAIQIVFLRNELKSGWKEFKRNPVMFSRRITGELFRRMKKSLSTPNFIPALLTAIVMMTSVILIALLIDKKVTTDTAYIDKPEVVLLDLSKTMQDTDGPGIGKNGPGRVGFNKGTGEGSGPSARLAHGGGGGGNHNPIPSQTGKLPPPSDIQAQIPTAPPINPPVLPAAGIDIDPALWSDLKTPVYGEPRSKSTTESKGPGEGDGIGTNRGLGIGAGSGPGYGPGQDGNIGDGSRQLGCCGSGGGTGEGGGFGGGSPGGGGGFSVWQVEQRARLLFKPEPQYTEEARRNQITGTVMLRVIFSSTGEVAQIHAIRTLPFGLTEKAIAAARQIKFVPAMKGGHPVSVFMQLEYNFNLY